MNIEKELIETISSILDRMEKINQRLDGLVDLTMGALDKTDDLEDKVSNALDFFEKKELQSLPIVDESGYPEIKGVSNGNSINIRTNTRNEDSCRGH